MIQVTPHMKIFLGIDALDMRKGIDSIVSICNDIFLIDPFKGALFIFMNRSRNRLRLLMYDGQGYWICTKRLSQGRFPWWPKTKGKTMLIEADKVPLLLRGGNIGEVKTLDDWKKLH